jgi:PAS domain S-box-containing protein
MIPLHGGYRIISRLLPIARVASLFIFAGGFNGISHAVEMPRRVVMLNAYNLSEPLSAASTAARKRLLERYRGLIGIDVDYLDLLRASDPDHEQRTAEFLRKYAAAPPDVIMTFGSAALPFILKHRDAIAPKAPIVFMAVSPENYSLLKPPSDVTGILLDLDLSRTLSLAERLQPNATRLIVVAGSTRVERLWQNIARRTIEAREKKYDTTYLFEMPFIEVVNELSRLPADAIVLMTSFLVDTTGQSFVPNTASVTFSAASPAPIYTPYISQLGKGIIGGFSETFEGAGEAAADIALEILAGKSAADIPPRRNPDGAYRVDIRAMQRHGLDESRLPPGTIVMFREPSVWERHRVLALTASAIIAVLTALVFALLIQRYRRRIAENLLKESEERMSFTAASVNAGFWQYDPATRELWTTPHSARLFGLSSDALRTRDAFVSAVHLDDRTLAANALETSADTVNDVRVVMPDGQARWIRIRTKSHGERGAPNRLTGIFIDITEQKAAEAEAHQKREEVAHLMRVSAVGELSGAIAHEINQPLTAISTNAHAALDMIPPGSDEFAELRETLQDIIAEDNRASEVIAGLRNLLKKETKSSVSFDVNRLVSETIRLLNSELVARRITTSVELGEDLAPLFGDAVQIQQLLLNLMMNAMDAMADTPPAQRHMKATTRNSDQGTLEIHITDTGSGMPFEQKSRVFEPFYTTKAHGLGLGLTICSTIVRAHGGTLQLTSESGRGAMATISLPAKALLVAAK